VQLVEFAEDAYVPAKQTEHAVDEAIEYSPVPQMLVTAVSPVVVQYDPAGQELQ